MKTFVTLFHRCIKLSLSKDVIMIPSIMQSEFNYKSKFVCLKWNENDYVKENSPVEIEFLNGTFSQKDTKSIFPRKEYIKYLMKNSKSIDVLNLYHLRFPTVILAYVYKLVNPKGKVFVKADFDERTHSTFSWHKLLYIYLLLKQVSFISLESKRSCEIFKHRFNKFQHKIRYIPNGIAFNKEDLKSNIAKDNIIITIGRIGTNQKNNDMMLEALTRTDLKDWQFFFIGPIEKSFEKKIQNFFRLNPQKTNQVHFKGAEFNKEKLINYYKRAKVFCLTSKFESYGIVLAEALFFDNYILSTNVGAASDITDNFKYGCEINSVNDLSQSLSNIVENKIDLSNYHVPDCHKIIFDYYTNLKSLDL